MIDNFIFFYKWFIKLYGHYKTLIIIIITNTTQIIIIIFVVLIILCSI